jgi:hypothetical protein
MRPHPQKSVGGATLYIECGHLPNRAGEHK